MAHLTVISYYTTGTAYEREAERLRDSLDRVGMRYQIEGVRVAGDWYDATAEKARVIAFHRRHTRGPLLWIDADAVVHDDCAPYFECLADRGFDFGAHYFAGPSWPGKDERLPLNRLLSGTLFFGDTDRAFALTEAWSAMNQVLRFAGIREGGGQKNLWFLTTCVKDLRIARLPGKYCYVFDKPWAYPQGARPVIEHLIASRENRGDSTVDASRRKRIEQLDAMA